MAYFPMYINLNDKECLICGGGKVALRKVQVLLDFGARLVVVSPEFCPELSTLCKTLPNGEVSLQQRLPRESDFEGKAVVIAATDDRKVNHSLAEIAKEHKIPVNAVDQVEDCTFIFPSYIMEKNLVAAFSSGGNSPVITQYLKEHAKKYLTPELGEINEYLGSLRPQIKAQYATEAERKAAYRRILEEELAKLH